MFQQRPTRRRSVMLQEIEDLYLHVAVYFQPLSGQLLRRDLGGAWM